MNSAAVNVLGCLALVLTCLSALWFRVRISKEDPGERSIAQDRYSMDELIAFIKHQIHELSRNPSNDWGMNEEAWKRKVKSRAELRQALKGCVHGDPQDKRYVKMFIRDLLQKGYGINESNIGRIIPFDQREKLTAQDRFDIVLYLYEKKHGPDGLSTMIDEYGLDRAKAFSEAGEGEAFEITAEDIDRIFYREFRLLSFPEKLDLVVQRVYQMYKGFSVIDAVREQRIDGVSGGVSGIPGNGALWGDSVPERGGEWPGVSLDEDGKKVTRAWDSVWIFYKGKSLRLSFLTFGSEAELKRVCQNIYKFNLPGQLSEANGYKVNEMKDGSRVVVVRPPFAETWAFFVRKFDVKSASLENLIEGKNAELPAELLKFLMKGNRITAITGSQGSGKTTLLMALVKHIDPSYTLRVQEMSFELHLRRMYTARNILTFKETEYVTGQAGLDVQKKTDGTVNILGEVATDEVAAWMIQMGQVASLFTIFTHHAKTFRDLVDSLRNSLLKTGVFRDERIAEEQVAKVLDFDVHLCKDRQGNRYIERISECCKQDERRGRSREYAGDHSQGGLLGRSNGYRERVIVEYRNGGYFPVEPLSMKCQEEMLREMSPREAARFGAFLDKHWGERLGA